MAVLIAEVCVTVLCSVLCEMSQRAQTVMEAQPMHEWALCKMTFSMFLQLVPICTVATFGCWQVLFLGDYKWKRPIFSSDNRLIISIQKNKLAVPMVRFYRRVRLTQVIACYQQSFDL